MAAAAKNGELTEAAQPLHRTNRPARKKANREANTENEREGGFPFVRACGATDKLEEKDDKLTNQYTLPRNCNEMFFQRRDVPTPQSKEPMMGIAGRLFNKLNLDGIGR